MASYVTKKNKDSRIDVAFASCRNAKFKGSSSYLLSKEKRRFNVSEAGYIDFIVGGVEDDYDWLEKHYGIGRKWHKFNEDDIGVE